MRGARERKRESERGQVRGAQVARGCGRAARIAVAALVADGKGDDKTACRPHVGKVAAKAGQCDGLDTR